VKRLPTVPNGRLPASGQELPSRWYLPLHARGLGEVIEGEQLAPIHDLM
jgi:hypothetical protein